MEVTARGGAEVEVGAAGVGVGDVAGERQRWVEVGGGGIKGSGWVGGAGRRKALVQAPTPSELPLIYVWCKLHFQIRCHLSSATYRSLEITT